MPPLSRRDVLTGAAASSLATAMGPALAQATSGPGGAGEGPRPGDRVFLCNEDSSTLAVIDPVTNRVTGAVNLTSFDEDPRPPFRFATGGAAPSHGAMVQKPLYHGAIAIHGAAPSPDGRLIATTGRGSSNVYLIDTTSLRVVGNEPNPLAGPATNPERLTTGVLVGREPHEPTFTRDGRELWVTVRGEGRIAVIDVERALSDGGRGQREALVRFVATVEGPSQVWFSADGSLAFVASQKRPLLDVLEVRPGEAPRRKTTIDLAPQDKFGFTPFQKTSPDGRELWLSHKLADALSVVDTGGGHQVLDAVPLGPMARPNHVELVDNAGGRVVYASLARVDDRGPDGAPSSRIAIIDRSAPPGRRTVTGSFFSGGREAHGLWVDPSGSVLYVAHEQDELPGTPGAGQTVCTAFDVRDPFAPRMVARIVLGEMGLPSGRLRHKKSINLVYVRPGARSQAG